MPDCDIPCPHCGEILVLDASTAGQLAVCPACDALVPMPDSPPDPSRPDPSAKPGKPALPALRPKGEKPRAFSEHATEPILPADGEAPLRPAPADITSRRGKSSLPSQRKKDRELPALTPAPYQAEPTSGTTPSVRAELPGRRSPDEPPRFRAPATGSEPADSHAAAPASAAPAPAPAAPAPATATAAEAADAAAAATAAKSARHRFGTSRNLEMKRQESVELDPEVADSWGRDHQEGDASRRGTRKTLIWALLIGAPLVAYALWHSLGRPGVRPTEVTPPAVAPAGAGVDPVEETRQASEAVRRFLSTSTLEDRAALVRHADVTKPRMEAWYTPANPLKPQTVLEFHDRASEQTIDGMTFLMLSMNLDDHTKRAVAVEKRADGEFLIDWESFVFWSETRWPEFLSKEPAGSHEFRVTLTIDDYFNFGYTDPGQWFCYKLEDPEAWAHCWGYCAINSEVGMKINRMIRRQRQQGQSAIKAIVRLKFEEGGKSRNQVLIEEVIQDGWVKPGA